MPEKIVHITPARGCAKGRLKKAEIKALSERDRVVRACQVCGIVYRACDYAWRCERWHWGD